MSNVRVRELRADLTVMGRSPVPPPRPSFMDGLEERLTAIESSAVATDREPEIVESRGRAGLTVVVALAVVLSTVGLAAVSQGDGRGGRTATVATASPSIGGRHSPAAAERDLTATSVDTGAPAHRGRGGAAWPASSRPTGSSAAGSLSTALAEDAALGDDMTPPVFADPGAARSIALRGSGTPAYTFLDWDRYDGDDFAAYLVLRAAAPDDPSWPDASGRTIMLQRIEDRDTVHHNAEGKVGTTPRFRIVAVNHAGDVVASTGVYQADVAAGIRAPSDKLQPLPPRS